MTPKYPPHKASVAPMMDWTDRHCRYFHRLLTKRALLYTEMVTADAVIHGNRDQLLGFNAEEHPVALQLGGADPAKLGKASAIGADYGYDEINLNVGCPSDRVQSGRFGACLMAEPELVADCIGAMKAALPRRFAVSVKCRIGIDDQDSEEALERFVTTIAAAGCNNFIVHARKAWLKGLNPKQNREVPPLDYGRVHRLKESHKNLTISINGGITTIEQAQKHLETMDGVMLGRAAYQNPWLLSQIDHKIFADAPSGLTRDDVMDHLMAYTARHLAAGGRLHAITRHILGLYAGQPRARKFRRQIAEYACKDGAGLDVLRAALALVQNPLLSQTG